MCATVGSMTGLRLVVVFLGALLCASCAVTVEEPKKAEVAVEESHEGDTIKDLDTAETKEFYYALKSKVDSLIQPFMNLKSGSSYRQYYSAPPSFGYQNKFTNKFMQQILDCYDNGQGYASGSGYYGGSVTPTKSYFIGGKPVYSSGSYNNGYSNQGYSSFGTSGSGYYAGSSLPSKQNFIGGKPVYPSGVSYDNGYSSQGSSFGATFSGSASIGGGAGYSPDKYNSGYNGFQPSKTYYSSSAYNPQSTGNAGYYFSSNYPGYNSQKSYDSQVSVGTSGSGQGYYVSPGYPGLNYNSKSSVNPNPSYYYSNTYPQVQQPQYVQSTVPLQQPINSPSSTFNSQSFVYVSTPKNVDVSTEKPPAPFSVAIIVPPGGSVSETGSSNNQGVNPVNQPTTTIAQHTTTVSPLPEYSSTAVPITPRPQYNVQSTQTPVIDGNRQSGYSIYASDSYLSRPYAYSPAIAYGYPVNSAPGLSPQPNGVYLVQNYPVSGAGNYQFDSPAVYPGSSSGVGDTNGYEVVTQGPGVVFPTAAPVTPHVHCN